MTRAPAAAFVLAFVVGYVVVGAAGWERFTPSACVAERRCYCEADAGGLFRQPANTASNLGFLVVALAITAELDRRRARLLTADTGFALLVALVGVGSVAKHGTLTMLGGKLDVASMLAFAAFLVADAASKGRPRVTLTRAFVGLAGASLALYALWPRAGATVVGMLALGYGALAWRSRTGWLAFAGACFAAALAFWLLSQTDGVLCAPGSAWQDHAAWSPRPRRKAG